MSARGDWERAAEWTRAFDRFCARTSLSTFPGVCRLHRAEVLTVRGQVAEAEREIRASRTLLEEEAPWAAGDAARIEGDLLHLVGNLEPAIAAYERAHRLGWDPQPGLARALIDAGDAEAAIAGLKRSIDGGGWINLLRRGQLLAHLSMAHSLLGDLDDARSTLRDLADVVEAESTPELEALFSRARAELLLAEGRADRALADLEASLRGWRQIDALHRIAETWLRLAETLHLGGNDEAARLEAEGAAALARRIGARFVLSAASTLSRELGQQTAPTRRE